MKRLLLLVILLICTTQLNAQNQYNVWYTGSSGVVPAIAPGIDFNSGVPLPLSNSSMEFTEGSTVMCDNSGNLLFYTDGTTIWNANHDTLQNGDGLANGAVNVTTTTQNSIVIPYVDTNYYGLIINEGLNIPASPGIPASNGTGLFYSVIDRSLDGGLGGINNVKDIPIVAGTDEKLVAIRHANGCDFWIVTVIQGNYYAYLFTSPQDYTSTDLSCTIIDTVISVMPGPYDPDGAFNRIRVSPTNDKIAVKESLSGNVFTLDFDNSTGVFSNPFQIADIAGIGVTASMNMDAYSFSPDGSYLYLITDTSLAPLTTPNVSRLYQFDMTVAQAAQPATMQYIGTFPDSTATGVITFQYTTDIQIGPDGKLYVSYYSFYGDNVLFLSAINDPNTSTPTITEVAVSFNGLRTHHTLPNLITDYLIDTIKSPCSYPLIADFGVVPSCFPSPFSFVDNTSGEPESWEWDFDDPSSGASNLSSLQNPAHTFTSIGTYNVELIVTRGCRLDTISQLITISSSNIYSDTVNICSGESALIHGVNQTVAGVYTDTLTSISGCDSVVSTTLFLFPLATSNNSQNICQGDSILLGGLFQTTAGVYNDTIPDGSANGCDSIASFTLVVDPLPVVSFSSTPNTGLLPLSVDFMNTSTGADIYSWDFGDGGVSASTDPSYVYLTEGDFTVVLTASSADGCTASLSFSYINVSELVELQIPNVFTPNGDGENDNFYVTSAGLESVHMGIFNRWGQLLSEWTTIGAYWDGRSMSGKLAPEGTYFYVYSAITIGGEVLRQNGAITLLR